MPLGNKRTAYCSILCQALTWYAGAHGMQARSRPLEAQNGIYPTLLHTHNKVGVATLAPRGV